MNWSCHTFFKNILGTVIILFVTLFFDNGLHAQSNRVPFFGRKPPVADTIPYLNIFDAWKWDGKIFLSGEIPAKEFKQFFPDTLSLNNGEWITLNTECALSPKLLHREYTIKYKVKGSLLISVNGEKILETGAFAKSRSLVSQMQSGFVNFTVHDTLLTMQVTYRQHTQAAGKRLSIAIGNADWGEESKTEQQQEKYMTYATGAFYFAFAIVFLLLFVFNRTQFENLYFALFCLFVSVYILIDLLYDSFLLDHISKYSIVIAIEFLSLFFATILVGKPKTKIPLCIIFLLGLITCHPYFLYLNDDTTLSTVFDFLFAFLLFLVSLSALYFLLQGFGKKKWEAKSILYGSLAGSFIGVILPILLAIAFPAKYPHWVSQYKILGYLSSIGFSLYPLTAAYVIGKRSGINQKQLLAHVNQIEKLSQENLQKEQEKKKILEEQNSQLELKVKERTGELAAKNDLITLKNKEITDSLIYAKRIQAAILPDKKMMLNSFDDAFILYLPKDIVSGDFYSFMRKENKIIIAAADCTGHGVAGAFMSMIGTSLLNQIINEKNITAPASILEHLNDGIITALKQKESDTNDGMDISMCTFDLDAMTGEFAGANRPLLLLRKGELTTYKPNKLPIGGLQIVADKKYTTTQIDLVKDDHIYFYTDGYADQFGGTMGKKLMIKKFKESLLAIENKTMSEQKDHLRRFFYEWKGHHDQVDDVLVIGIKI